MKLGKRPARRGAVKLLFENYVNLSRLPTPPAEFGDEKLIRLPLGMLGNDRFGCCAWSGAAHETMGWTAASGKQVSFTTQGVLSDYSACTGFTQNDPATDGGTDMQEAAKYRQKVGIIDSQGVRHKIGAYAAISPGDIELLLAATYCFEHVGVGVRFPRVAMDQFDDGHPWDLVPGMMFDGGHYIPCSARRNAMFVFETWGAFQPGTDAWVRDCMDEGLVYFSPDMLNGTKSLEGFDAEALNADLSALQGQSP